MWCISAKCCYSPIGPKSDSLCWCSNRKLGHFHALEFLWKWLKVKSIPREYWLFNTWNKGQATILRSWIPAQQESQNRAWWGQPQLRKAGCLIWLNSVSGNHVTRSHPLLGQEGAEREALCLLTLSCAYQPLASIAAPWGRYEWCWMENKRCQVEQTCNSCTFTFPVMLTCCFSDICVKQSFPPHRSVEKKNILKPKLGFIQVLKMSPCLLNPSRWGCFWSFHFFFYQHDWKETPIDNDIGDDSLFLPPPQWLKTLRLMLEGFFLSSHFGALQM